jgi:hypothetical protein
LQVAIADEQFDPQKINLNLTDLDVDAYEHDTVFAAAADYAGGATWVPESVPAKRREFWHYERIFDCTSENSDYSVYTFVEIALYSIRR